MDPALKLPQAPRGGITTPEPNGLHRIEIVDVVHVGSVGTAAVGGAKRQDLEVEVPGGDGEAHVDEVVLRGGVEPCRAGLGQAALGCAEALQQRRGDDRHEDGHDRDHDDDFDQRECPSHSSLVTSTEVG